MSGRAAGPAGGDTVLIALDKFKGSIDAAAACRALANGMRQAGATAVTCCPVADGGDGTIDALVTAGYRRIPVTVPGPTGRPINSSFAVHGTTAVIELAQICGLQQLPGGVREPWRSGTYGLGVATRSALDVGADHIVLALGGSASTDGGLGLLLGLGAQVRDATGTPCSPDGQGMITAADVDLSGLDPRLERTRVSVATDVTSPLTGPTGAAHVFAPQKGATAADVAVLEPGLRRWATLLTATRGVTADQPGAGAAGGTAAAAIATLGAAVISGADFVLDAVGFDDHLHTAGLVVIGEGSFDEQSEAGKAPLAVLHRAVSAAVPVVLVAGRVAATPGHLTGLGIHRSYQLLDLQPDPAAAMRSAADLLARTGRRIIDDHRPRIAAPRPTSSTTTVITAKELS